MRQNLKYAEFDLASLGFLPQNWQEEILNLAFQHSYLTRLDGTSSTSREKDDFPGAEVYVVDGTSISRELTWLQDLYQTHLLALANSLGEEKYTCGNKIDSQININLLKGVGARYEWHVDSNPLTGLLFVNTLEQMEGGELAFQTGDRLKLVRPEAGKFILFDARDVPHTVLPLNNDSFRVTVPMNYYHEGENQIRPIDLDTYIYKK